MSFPIQIIGVLQGKMGIWLKFTIRLYGTLPKMELLLLVLVIPLLPFYLTSLLLSLGIFVLGVPFVVVHATTTVLVGFLNALLTSKLVPALLRLRDRLHKWSVTGDLYSYRVERIPSNLIHSHSPKPFTSILEPNNPHSPRTRQELSDTLMKAYEQGFESDSDEEGALNFSAPRREEVVVSEIKGSSTYVSNMTYNISEVEAEESLQVLLEVSGTNITPGDSASRSGSLVNIALETPNKSDAAKLLYSLNKAGSE